MSALPLSGIDQPSPLEPDVAMFEQHPAIYGLWRERLFRDDTERICTSLWGAMGPAPGAIVLEVGCGPGHYARRLATRFESLLAVGIDNSEAQLRRARAKAQARGLRGCRFERADARDLPHGTGSVDAVIVSRLFTVLRERERVMSEIHRVLRPGGRVFIAEPRSSLRTGLALELMRLAARAANLLSHSPSAPGACPPATILDQAAFAQLTESQPWSRVGHQADRWYQYAVCEKRG